ncbi:MAG: class I SAM-dependent methyltransferase [Bacteroidota bacterium]
MNHQAEPYTKLAPLYDTLMQDVDYESWADYLDEIIQTHHPDAYAVLELACGTGNLALSLSELETYRITASDGSPEMMNIAAQRFEAADDFIRPLVLNFLTLNLDERFDVIFTLFDSVNYLHSDQDIQRFLDQTLRVLKPGGLLIFDFSTPKNSLESVDYLNNDYGTSGLLRFQRSSRYDTKEGYHYNEFIIEELNDEGSITGTFSEVHRQKAYTLEHMLSIVEQTPYHRLASYEDFELEPATEHSTRVTMVLQCQTLP